MAEHRLDVGVATLLAQSGLRIVVTGAGGWLGLATLDLLHKALGDDFAKRVCAFGSTARVLRLADGTPVLQRPLADMAWLPSAPTLVLHLAFLTKDRADSMDEAAYRAANQAISATVLNALGPIGAIGLFLASSGAAALADDPAASDAMRRYGAMKRDDEISFTRWADDHQHRAVILRIHNLTGPYMNKPQAYALASFMGDALAGRPIAVRAPRRVVRGYVAIREMMSLVLAMLLDESCGVRQLDTGGEPMELAEVAQAIANALPGAQVQRAAITQPQADIYHGNARPYAAALAAYDIAGVDMDGQLSEALAYFAAQTP
ncbi:MAG: NAD(P)-dependent oxidoreductase [Sphingomonadales bacterium]|nr:NAD(P)-dependent oxidoreductase [Sphingomonadales bacterium]MDE2168851.1 NAD(P)-dependent oxidoreductase [Sphingomonadales bacterium]